MSAKPTFVALSSLATAALVLFLATRALTTLPATWYDEGVNLQAARNLARTGIYGLTYAAGEIRPFDLQLTTGPTVIAPTAAVFKLWQVGLGPGRLVMLAYTLTMLLGLYLAGRLLYGHAAGVIGVLVLSATDQAAPSSAREVVGEVAALAYLFWGVAALAVARSQPRWYLGAGLLFGLAVLTKGQFALVVPALVGAWLIPGRGSSIARLMQRDPAARQAAWSLGVLLLAMAVPVALWQAYQVLSLSPAGFAEHLREQSAALAVSSGAPFLSLTPANVEYLLDVRLALPVLVGLAYVILRELRGAAPERLVLPLFGALWLAWYLGFSVGYARYTVPLLAVCSLLLAVLARDVLLRVPGSTLRSGALLLVAVPVAVGLVDNVRTVTQPPEPFAQQMAAIITREVTPTASIESIEWELDVLTERPFHHPPPFVPLIPYSVPDTTTFLVDGPASKSTQLYVQELASRPYIILASAGPYDLYKDAAQ